MQKTNIDEYKQMIIVNFGLTDEYADQLAQLCVDLAEDYQSPTIEDFERFGVSIVDDMKFIKDTTTGIVKTKR